MATATEVVKFHLSLNSSDLPRSISFYSVLFGCEPAKVKLDYAKFEIEEPPLIMSMIPAPVGAGGNMNHVGLRLTDSAALVAMQARLEGAGYSTQREEGVECCYSKQTKFWVTDPDRTLWELYVMEDDDADHHNVSHTPSTLVTLQTLLATPPQPKVVWQHLITQPLPERIEQADDSVDEVLLQGTLNMELEPARLQRFLAEVRRVLKPSGSVMAHHLSGDRALGFRPQLPGPAALVEHVPVDSDAVAAMSSVGLANVEVTTLGAKPCFTVGEVRMHEMRIMAYKPAAQADCTAEVMYKGPLSQVSDDLGHAYPRGRRVSVPAAAAEMLQQGAAAGQFVFFNSADCCSGGGCGG